MSTGADPRPHPGEAATTASADGGPEPAGALVAPPPRGAEAADVRSVPRTRAGALWVSLGAGVVIVALLGLFILENLQPVTISFFGARGSLPLALALLFAALGGAALVMAAGAARIVQLRQLSRRRAKTDASGPGGRSTGPAKR